MLLWRLWRWWRARRVRQEEEPVEAVAAPPPGAGPRPTGNPLPKLFVASLKMIVRDRRTVIFALVVPLLFAVLFGVQDYGAAKQVAVTATVVPAGQSAFERQVVAGLKRDGVFRVTERGDLGGARKKLIDGTGDVVLAVPTTPGPPLTVYFKSDSPNRDFALGSLQRFVDTLNLRLAGVTSPEVRLASEAVNTKDTNYYDFLLPGLIAWSVMNLSIIGIAVSVTRFREQQILKRILATPLAPGKFLLAQVGARMVLALSQAAVIIAVAVGGFGAHVHGDPVWLFVYVALGNLVFLNIGFAIAGRAKNTDSAQSMAQMISLPMVFLSGVFFPTTGLPPVLSQVVSALPLSPLTHALRSISLDGAPVTKTWPQLALLLAWVAVSLLIARRSFRFGESRPSTRLSLARAG